MSMFMIYKIPFAYGATLDIWSGKFSVLFSKKWMGWGEAPPGVGRAKHTNYVLIRFSVHSFDTKLINNVKKETYLKILRKQLSN